MNTVFQTVLLSVYVSYLDIKMTMFRKIRRRRVGLPDRDLVSYSVLLQAVAILQYLPVLLPTCIPPHPPPPQHTPRPSTQQ
jgi:hypothetical protein